MYSLKLVLDKRKDARNRFDACNKTSHWVNRKERIDKDVADKIVGKTEDEAYVFLLPYLENLYKKNEEGLNKVLKFGQELIDRDIDAACKRMEEVTDTKMYRNDFVWYLTTFPRMPYNYKEWSVYICCNWSIKNYLGNFLHELLHFQFIHYFSDHPAVIRLNQEQFEFLKESLTFLLNSEFKEFLGREDSWYALHQSLRKELAEYRKNKKDFEGLIVYWANVLQKTI